MARPRFKTGARKNAAAESSKKRDTAWLAVQQFNKMTPMLSAFARTITGNAKLNVRAGKMSATDGKTIFVRPPLALAESSRHERSLCDERDENMRLLCVACRTSEQVWRTVHHEISHIVGNSMAPSRDDVIADLIKVVYEWHPTNACTHGREIEQKIRRSVDYLGVFEAFSAWSSLITQSLEDARIDSMMLRMKPGLRKQFYAENYRIFTEGNQNDNGEYFLWRDAPINAQLVIGLMLMGSGYVIEDGWLRPEVIEILGDEKLNLIADEVETWDSVHDSASGTIRAFVRLNEMGFCKEEKCVPVASLNNPGDSPGEGESNNEADSGGDDAQSGADPDAGGDVADSPADNADASSDGGDGSGDTSSDVSEDATGDGTAGGSASSGAFGDDFENPDARSSGSDQEVRPADDQSVSDGVSGDDRGDLDSEGDVGGEDNSSQPGGDGGQDQADSVDSAADEGEGETSDPQNEEGVSGNSESPSEDVDSSADVDPSPVRGTGDISGSPSDQEKEAGEESLDAASGEGSDESVDGTVDGAEPDDSRDEAFGEDAEGERVDESVWDDYIPEEKSTLHAASFSDEELGVIDQVADLMKREHGHQDTEFEQHEVDPDAGDEDGDDKYDYEDERVVISDDRALDDAISQSMYFDKSSQGVGGVSEYTFPTKLFSWESNWRDVALNEYMPSEAIIGKALLAARIIFAANKRASHTNNLKSGRINTRVLGRRAPLGDERLFKRKETPSKRDYVVAITVDCSGSTGSFNRMNRIKRAVFAKAELLSRLGVPFYITGHTGGRDEYWKPNGRYTGSLENLMILWIKKLEEPWNDDTRRRLANLAPLANNYDGHTLEFHRKILERRRETDRILIYYTDGEMPAANPEEELEVLQTELINMDRAGIKKLAVGINTTSPEAYGFDTVKVESDEDLIKVVEQLKTYLTH